MYSPYSYKRQYTLHDMNIVKNCHVFSVSYVEIQTFMNRVNNSYFMYLFYYSISQWKKQVFC